MKYAHIDKAEKYISIRKEGAEEDEAFQIMDAQQQQRLIAYLTNKMKSTFLKLEEYNNKFTYLSDFITKIALM